MFKQVFAVFGLWWGASAHAALPLDLGAPPPPPPSELMGGKGPIDTV